MTTDEVARLILMDLPSRSYGMYARELIGYDSNVSLVMIQDLWDRYMGREGRTTPTHDITTGERLT